MKLRELDDLLVRRLVEVNHPEVVRIRVVATPDQPANHTRVVIDFADGSTGYVMVAQVAGPGVERHPAYELPAGVL